MTLRLRALNILARREHSRAELARKLGEYGEADEIEALLDRLEQENLLSNSRYVEMLAHARAGKHGSLRLKADLREKGVSASEMEDALENAQAQDLDAARAVWQKKFGALSSDASGRARQYRFLASRGFPTEVIRRVLGGSDDE
ncbi:MAG: recombination regulator RecX [Hydrogenophilales bacterium 28-61-23]|nr:MAG: recombination regulator RecX [Hydrogenophilales bacterium 28-61-23]